MLNGLKLGLGTVNIFEDLEDRTQEDTKIADQDLTDEDKAYYMSIFKIPKYLEKVN